MSDIVIPLDVFDIDSVQNAAERLKAYYRRLDRQAREICGRLASLGAVRASLGFSRAIYNGNNDVHIDVEQIDSGYRINANGEAVLFIEFGSGAAYGYGHPDPQGYGPGTYPGKGHWNDPNGWWYGHGQHSFGNPPAAAMYNAEQEIRQNIERVAREVLGRE